MFDSEEISYDFQNSETRSKKNETFLYTVGIQAPDQLT